MTLLPAWRGALEAGAWCALASVALIPVQIATGAVWLPPSTPAQAFSHVAAHPAAGLLSLDLVYLLNNAVILPVYLALTVALWERRRSWVANALLCAGVEMAGLFSSNRSLELLALWRVAADLPAEVVETVAVGMLATWKGTGFVVYYVLNAVALLLFAGAMLGSPHFSQGTARWGLAAGLLMVVPSTFGTLGLVFALASLLPWGVFGVRVWRELRALARSLPTR